MQVVSIISTKGGVGKTTTAANLGGFAADAGLRVLLLDLDVQPTLSSYFTLAERAPAGIYEMLAYNEQRAKQLVSRTAIAGLDLVLSPVTPEILAARELRRGTLQLIEDIAPYRHLGIEPPPLHLLINRVHPVSSNARLIQQALRQAFQGQPGVRVLDTDVPAIEAYPRAATRGLPVHRVEYRQPAGRSAPAALDTMRALAGELFPAWRARFALVTGRENAGGAGHGQRA
ncbi:MAG: ParA family protein [Brachymonas sp.]